MNNPRQPQSAGAARAALKGSLRYAENPFSKPEQKIGVLSLNIKIRTHFSSSNTKV